MKKLRFLWIGVFVQTLCVYTHAQIQHVEPSNWWVGMKNPTLQLMIHGKDIGETAPIIDYQGVTIQKVSKGDSPNYLFIDLMIDKTTKVGTFKIRFQKAKQDIYVHNYTLLERSQKAEDYKGFSSADVMYLIMPDRFTNGDYTNDVVKGMRENTINRRFEGGRHGGDLKGITQHLDYIANQGFTALWLNPVLENDMPHYSYHGYAITNHYQVDPRYGTLDDYKTLAINAKRMGIKLIFDGVINHIGSNHWWLKDLPFKNWLNYPNAYQQTNHQRTVNQDPYSAQFDKNLMTSGWFDKSMPDLNGRNPFMATYLIQNSIWWIETLQLGGIRQDTYGYSDKDFLTQWSCTIMDAYPNFNMVGEEWSYNPLITSYWQKGKVRHDGYTSCLKSVMDFPLQKSLIQALKTPENRDFSKGLFHLYESLANDFTYADPNNLLIFGDNHDMDRIFTQLNQDVRLTQMALTYLFTIRGIPQIYYGTEFLMENSQHLDNHGFIRSDFAGGWRNDTINAFTGEGLNANQREMQAYIKKLLAWRKNATVIHSGKTLHFAPFDGVYVYFRYNDNQLVMVVLNKNDKAITIDNQRFIEILKSKSTATNVMTGDKTALNQLLSIAAKSAMVYEIF